MLLKITHSFYISATLLATLALLGKEWAIVLFQQRCWFTHAYYHLSPVLFLRPRLFSAGQFHRGNQCFGANSYSRLMIDSRDIHDYYSEKFSTTIKRFSHLYVPLSVFKHWNVIGEKIWQVLYRNCNEALRLVIKILRQWNIYTP